MIIITNVFSRDEHDSNSYINNYRLRKYFVMNIFEAG